MPQQPIRHPGPESTSPDAHSPDALPPCSLTQLRPGQLATVRHCELPDDERDLLRAMGLRDHSTVVLCRLGEPCIVRVMGGCGCTSRIGLSRPLAERVIVGPLPDQRSPAA